MSGQFDVIDGAAVGTWAERAVCCLAETNVGYSPHLARWTAWLQEHPGPYVEWQVEPGHEILKHDAVWDMDQKLYMGNKHILTSVRVPVALASRFIHSPQ